MTTSISPESLGAHGLADARRDDADQQLDLVAFFVGHRGGRDDPAFALALMISRGALRLVLVVRIVEVVVHALVELVIEFIVEVVELRVVIEDVVVQRRVGRDAFVRLLDPAVRLIPRAMFV